MHRRRLPVCSNRLVDAYFIGIAALLVATAVIKLISAFGSARVLSAQDPIFGFPNRSLYVAVALVEIIVAAIGVMGTAQTLTRCLAYGWLAGCFVLYRTAMSVLNISEPCACLGRATEWWPWIGKHSTEFSYTMICLLVAPLILLVSTTISATSSKIAQHR